MTCVSYYQHYPDKTGPIQGSGLQIIGRKCDCDSCHGEAPGMLSCPAYRPGKTLQRCTNTRHKSVLSVAIRMIPPGTSIAGCFRRSDGSTIRIFDSAGRVPERTWRCRIGAEQGQTVYWTTNPVVSNPPDLIIKVTKHHTGTVVRNRNEH